ncbi:MAG: glycosyltransferase family 4 protein [Halanaerobiales bacterium]|nr:glycosyltransferase family 4 protein [Halanaerobiales bacterium]
MAIDKKPPLKHSKEGMRLLIITGGYITYDGKYLCAVNPLYTEFFSCFSRLGDFEVSLTAPFKFAHTKTLAKIICAQKNMTYVCLPYWASTIDFFCRLPVNIFCLLKRLSLAIKGSDVVFIRLHTPLALIAYPLARTFRKQLYLFFVADIVEAVCKSERKGSRYAMALLQAKMFDRLYKYMAQNTLTFATKGELFERLSRVANACHEYIPSLISRTTINIREDTCTNSIVNILFVGRLVYSKGVQDLIHAVAKLSMGNRKIRITIVGTGPMDKELKTIVGMLKLSDSVHFVGHIPFGENLFQVYRTGDIFVLPTYTEGLPKVLFEAFAFGIPIIATKVGGIPSVISHEENGILINPGSPTQIASATKRIITDSSLRRKIVSNGYAWITKHTLEEEVGRIIKVINATAGTKGNKPVKPS